MLSKRGKFRKIRKRREKTFFSLAEREGLAIKWMKTYGPSLRYGKRQMREKVRKDLVAFLPNDIVEKHWDLIIGEILVDIRKSL